MEMSSLPCLSVWKQDKRLDLYVLDPYEIYIIGRHPECNIQVAHPTASRRHVELRIMQSTSDFIIEDLGSGHGTWTELGRLKAGVPVTLPQGMFRLGDSSREYRLEWLLFTREDVATMAFQNAANLRAQPPNPFASSQAKLPINKENFDSFPYQASPKAVLLPEQAQAHDTTPSHSGQEDCSKLTHSASAPALSANKGAQQGASRIALGTISPQNNTKARARTLSSGASESTPLGHSPMSMSHTSLTQSPRYQGAAASGSGRAPAVLQAQQPAGTSARMPSPSTREPSSLWLRRSRSSPLPALLAEHQMGAPRDTEGQQGPGAGGAAALGTQDSDRLGDTWSEDMARPSDSHQQAFLDDDIVVYEPSDSGKPSGLPLESSDWQQLGLGMDARSDEFPSDKENWNIDGSTGKSHPLGDPSREPLQQLSLEALGILPPAYESRDAGGTTDDVSEAAAAAAADDEGSVSTSGRHWPSTSGRHSDGMSSGGGLPRGDRRLWRADAAGIDPTGSLRASHSSHLLRRGGSAEVPEGGRRHGRGSRRGVPTSRAGISMQQQGIRRGDALRLPLEGGLPPRHKLTRTSSDTVMGVRSLQGPQWQWHIVVDTNCLLERESFTALRRLEGIQEVCVVIPHIVIRELESLRRQQAVAVGTSRLGRPRSHGAVDHGSDSRPQAALEWIRHCMTTAPQWLVVQRFSEYLTLAVTPPLSPAGMLRPRENEAAIQQWARSDPLASPTVEDRVLDCARNIQNSQVAVLTTNTALTITGLAEDLVVELPSTFCDSLLDPQSERFLWKDSTPRSRTQTLLNLRQAAPSATPLSPVLPSPSSRPNRDIGAAPAASRLHMSTSSLTEGPNGWGGPSGGGAGGVPSALRRSWDNIMGGSLSPQIFARRPSGSSSHGLREGAGDMRRSLPSVLGMGFKVHAHHALSCAGEAPGLGLILNDSTGGYN